MHTPSLLVITIGGWGAASPEHNPFYDGSFSFLGELISSYPSVTLTPNQDGRLHTFYQQLGGQQGALSNTLSAHHVKQFFIAGPGRYGLLTNTLRGGLTRNDEFEQFYYKSLPHVSNLTDCPELQTPDLLHQAEEKLHHNKDTVMFVALDAISSLLPYKNVSAVRESIKEIDSAVKKFVKQALENQWRILIVSDGGGAENYINQEKATIDTSKSSNPLPCLLISKDLEGLRAHDGDTAGESDFSHSVSGSVRDLAPTILSIMHIPNPAEMEGGQLFSSCLQFL